MIADTCRCGARFETDQAIEQCPNAAEHYDHSQWLRAHESCRRRDPEDPRALNNLEFEL